MIIGLDGKDLYAQIEIIKKQSKGETEMSEEEESSDQAAYPEKKVKKESDTQDYPIAIPIYNARIPLPFGSIDGRIIVLENNYTSILELNSPENLDLDRRVLEYQEGHERGELTPEGIKRLNEIESCLYMLPDALEMEFGSRYIRIGESIAGYILDGKGNPNTSIDRNSKTGMITVKRGGSGLNRLVLGEEKGFSAEMYVFSEDITRIVNSGINIAKDLKFIKSNPDITLKLGSIA